MLTDYHLHLRPDEAGTTVERYFTAENVERYLEAAAAAGIEELGVSEHVYRFRAGARPLAATRSGRERRATTSTPTASSSAARRCGSGSSATSSPAPRSAPRRCWRRATSTTSSARSTSSARATRGRPRRLRRLGGRQRPRRGLAPLLRGARPTAPAPASSTSSPTPTWSRSGAGPGRCPSATCAPSTSPRSKRSSRAGSRSRSRPPACASRSASSTRPAPSPSCASRRGCPSRSPPTPTCPSRSASATTGRIEFLDELGVGEIASSRGASGGWPRSAQPRRLSRWSASATTATASPRAAR